MARFSRKSNSFPKINSFLKCRKFNSRHFPVQGRNNSYSAAEPAYRICGTRQSDAGEPTGSACLPAWMLRRRTRSNSAESLSWICQMRKKLRSKTNCPSVFPPGIAHRAVFCRREPLRNMKSFETVGNFSSRSTLRCGNENEKREAASAAGTDSIIQPTEELGIAQSFAGTHRNRKKRAVF